MYKYLEYYYCSLYSFMNYRTYVEQFGTSGLKEFTNKYRQNKIEQSPSKKTIKLSDKEKVLL